MGKFVKEFFSSMWRAHDDAMLFWELKENSPA
jgi:hypothetical protein